MKKEIWKDIPGYEGLYKVSSEGRVKSLDKIDSIGLKIKGRILKQFKTGKVGYKTVSIYKNKKMKTIQVHKLVAIAFLGHTPCGNKIVVDHIDNDKTNNNLNNLQIISNRENTSKDRKGGSSKYVGVHWNKGRNKWRSMIRINGKQKHLGLFTNELDARDAYQEALKNLS